MLKKISLITAFVLVIVVCFVLGLITYNSTLATDNYTTIRIGGNSKAPAMFSSNGVEGQGPWYPGYSAKGTLKLINDYNRRVQINSLGMNISSLSKDGSEIGFEDQDAVSYLTNMKVKVEHKNPVDNLIKGKIFDGDFNTFKDGVSSPLSLNRNESIYLVYTITMDNAAQLNIAGITAKVDFTVNASVKSDLPDPSPSPSYDPDPPDVKDTDGHWAHDCIETLIEHGIIVGYPDETIRPENYITRAEVAVLVSRALKLDISVIDKIGYKDNIPNWARGYIYAASNEGIFTGYPGNIFKANNNITRQEITAVLMRAFEKEINEDFELEFTDKKDIDDWALEYIKAGVKNKVVEGYPDNTFKPNNKVTRAEVFTMLCKLLEYHIEHSE